MAQFVYLPGGGLGRIVPEWRNFHETLLNRDILISDYPALFDWTTQPAPTWSTADFAATVKHQQSILFSTKREMLAAGASWSHARLLKTDERILDMANLGGVLPLSAADMDGAALPPGLCLVAGGTRLKSLALWLQQRKFSLRTSGSHGAATLAGAFATGTHGARLNCRGVEEHVRGMLLVTGEDSTAWVAARGAPKPIMAFLQAIAPDVVEHVDDALFAAALNHLGGLGLVAAVLFEAEPLHEVEVVRQVVPLWPGWQADWSAQRFDAIARRVEAHARRLSAGWQPPGALLYCEVNLHPWHLLDGSGCFQLRYRIENTLAMTSEGSQEPAKPAIDLLGEAIAANVDEHGLVPIPGQLAGLSLPNIFEAAATVEQVPIFRNRLKGLPGNLLVADHERAKRWLQIWSSAIAVETSQVPAALDTLAALTATRTAQNFVACLRPVSRSSATLGFCSFDGTTVIDIDGLGGRWAGDSVERTGYEFQSRLKDAGIAHRMHWGKLAEPDANTIADSYGVAALASWHAARNTLLSADAKRVFTSEKLRTSGLA